MESQDVLFIPLCDDGTMPDDWVFLDWSRYLGDAASRVSSFPPLAFGFRMKKAESLHSGSRPHPRDSRQAEAMV